MTWGRDEKTLQHGILTSSLRFCHLPQGLSSRTSLKSSDSSPLSVFKSGRFSASVSAIINKTRTSPPLSLPKQRIGSWLPAHSQEIQFPVNEKSNCKFNKYNLICQEIKSKVVWKKNKVVLSPPSHPREKKKTSLFSLFNVSGTASPKGRQSRLLEWYNDQFCLWLVENYGSPNRAKNCQLPIKIYFQNNLKK